MEGAQIKESKKRSVGFMQAQELMSRLKSKADMIDYLDKHCEYQKHLSLIPM